MALNFYFILYFGGLELRASRIRQFNFNYIKEYRIASYCRIRGNYTKYSTP
jgi:hypothetical protein